MYKIHNYETMTPEKRPQDPGQDGEGWRFVTLEHGGERADDFPNAIRAYDAEGRSCLYQATTEGGKVVDSKGYRFDTAERARA